MESKLSKFSIIALSVAVVMLTIFTAGCSTSVSKNAGTDNTAGQNTQASVSIPVTGNKQGNIAPDIDLKDVNGLDYSLGKNAKIVKPTLVYFFATWCPYCRQDFATLKNVYPDYQNEVDFVAVDVDPKETNEQIKEFQKKMGLDDITFIKSDVGILSDYGITATTTKFAVGRNSTILWTGSGDASEKQWGILLNVLKMSE